MSKKGFLGKLGRGIVDGLGKVDYAIDSATDKVKDIASADKERYIAEKFSNLDEVEGALNEALGAVKSIKVVGFTEMSSGGFAVVFRVVE